MVSWLDGERRCLKLEAILPEGLNQIISRKTSLAFPHREVAVCHGLVKLLAYVFSSLALFLDADVSRILIISPAES